MGARGRRGGMITQEELKRRIEIQQKEKHLEQQHHQMQFRIGFLNVLNWDIEITNG